MYKFNPRSLTKNERTKVEDLRDMINGNINRMCVTDDLVEIYDRARFVLQEVTSIIDIATDRFSDQNKEGVK